MNTPQLSRKRNSALLNHSVGLERLEDRCLLSAFLNSSTITFAEAPTLVQAGLTNLAATDNVAAPTDTTIVRLGNSNGDDTYTIDVKTTTPHTILTVDENGKTITPPTSGNTTFGNITLTAVTTEFDTIATALNLAQPATTANVTVLTNSDGTATYTLSLYPVASTSTSSRFNFRGGHSSSSRPTVITVDSNGDPVGNETVPFSTLSIDIQTGLIAGAPTGATALSATSSISVLTIDGVNTYTALYTGAGFRDQITVDDTGSPVTMPSTTTVQFSALPSAASQEIQTLATADGFSGNISLTQNVLAVTQVNATNVIYSVTLPVTTTTNSGRTRTSYVTITVDENGNPTTIPVSDLAASLFGGFGGFGGIFGGGGMGGGCF